MDIKYYTKITMLLLLGYGLMTLTACTTSGSKKKLHKVAGGEYTGLSEDGFPDNVPVDIHSIPDAKPKKEALSKYGNPEKYVQFGKSYKVMKTAQGYKEHGHASWYGKKFHGKRTSSGESYDMFAMTAAHKTLPIPSYVKVKNLDNGKEVVLRVNDRGPFHVDRIIDLSYTAAAKLGILGKGTGRVQVAAITPKEQHDFHQNEKKVKEAKEHKALIAKNTVEPPSNVSTKMAKTTSNAASKDKRIFIQLGAFSNRKSAESMMKKAQNLALSEEVQIHKGESKHAPIYRVRIGPIADETRLSSLQSKLIAQQYSAQRVTEN